MFQFLAKIEFRFIRFNDFALHDPTRQCLCSIAGLPNGNF
jgi:hypothetical protein